MGKKVFLFSLLVVLSGFLFGCERKTSTTGTGTPTGSSGPATGLTSPLVDVSATPESNFSDTTAPTANTNLDTESLKSTFAQNLTDTTTKVQKALKNTATFCTVLIEMPNTYSLAQAPQGFFFTTTNEGLKDWYWVVTIDPVEKKEKHSLAAKSSYKDELECTRLKIDEIKVSFDEAYQRAGETGALSSAGDTLKTKITLKDHSWKISQYDVEGKFSSKEVDATNAYVSSAATTSATPTSESIIK